MSSFTTPLKVTPQDDGGRWELQEEFDYHVGEEESTDVIRIPAGFVTDFASIDVVGRIAFWLAAVYLVANVFVSSPWLAVMLIPAVIYLALPRWAKYSKAPILHDWLYAVRFLSGEPITRKRADEIFLEAMIVDWRNHKSRLVLALVEYWAVRAFARWKGPK